MNKNHRTCPYWNSRFSIKEFKKKNGNAIFFFLKKEREGLVKH